MNGSTVSSSAPASGHDVQDLALRLLNQACDAARCDALDRAQAALLDAERALGDLSRQPDWSARLDLARANLAYFSDDLDTANELALRVHAETVRHGLVELRRECAGMASLQLALQERHAEAVAMAADALRLAEPDAHFPRYLALLSLGGLCQTFGQPQRAFPLYRRAMEHARARNDRIGFAATIGRMSFQQAQDAICADLHGRRSAEDLLQAVVGMRSTLTIREQAGLAPDPLDFIMLADLLWLQGEWSEIESILRKHGVEQFPYTPAPYLPARCRAMQGLLALRRGDREAAAAHLATAVARLPAAAPRRFEWREALTLRLVAELQRELGHDGAARHSAQRSVAALRRHDETTAALSAELAQLLQIAGLGHELQH